jgi:excisionase family DNA binding protein
LERRELKAELTLPDELVEQIADKVAEKIKPSITGNGKHDEVSIFTPDTLSKYLCVDVSWVYRQVSDKNIPYFKNGKYVRFKKSSIDKWIASHERQPIPKFKHLSKRMTA